MSRQRKVFFISFLEVIKTNFELTSVSHIPTSDVEKKPNHGERTLDFDFFFRQTVIQKVIIFHSNIY